MIAYRWESAKRYYVALLYRDLFGTWILRRVWGGRFNALGNERCEPVADETAGWAAITRIDALRQRHGYQRVLKHPCLG